MNNLIFKDLQYNIAIQIITEINQKIISENDYSHLLQKLSEIIVKKENLTDLYFDEYWQITYNCLYIVLKNAEIKEDYKKCIIIKKIIDYEEEVYKAWVETLPEETREEALDELIYIKIAINLERNG